MDNDIDIIRYKLKTKNKKKKNNTKTIKNRSSLSYVISKFLIKDTS